MLDLEITKTKPSEAPNYTTLEIKRDGQVDWLTLNRPARLNAVDRAMTVELRDYFTRLAQDHSVRIVVLRGAGRAFCSGVDLLNQDPSPKGDLGAATPVQVMRNQQNIAKIIKLMRQCPQPIISLVHGPACGIGFAFALASDMRIAGETARMNAAFIRIGLTACDVGVSYFLPRVVGVGIASELMMTGRFIQAARALQVGLVSEVVPDDKLEEAVKPYLAEMLATSPLALRLTKEGLNYSVDAGSLDAVMAMEDRQQVMTVLSDDHKEGVRAFQEKRPPAYTDK